MNEMLTWLRAQLDTDEQIANAALRDPRFLVDGNATADDGVWRTGDHPHDECGVEGKGIRIYDEGGHTAEQARHIANNDPARVLRQVQAHRAILDLHAPGGDPCDAHDASMRSVPCETLLALLSIYSDRDCFNPDWSA